ncbi:MAG: 2-C-methyl-D-erythritol 4-phosphate cytidylyltransferase [Verrucomicrobiota bacterium]
MNAAVIVAAGKGTRMGPDRDKIFLELAGRPVIAHTWNRFDSAPCIDTIVLAVREGMQSAFQEIAAQYGFRKPYQIIVGGKERQDSVWNGIAALPAGTDLVAIHDGARPCVTHALIAATLQAARETGAAVAGQKITDTIKETEDGSVIARTVDRSRLWSVQTPQSFRVTVIKQAIRTAKAQGLNLTDDTAACELIGQPVRLVAGESPNPKVTVPSDLPYIELLLKNG